MARTQRSHRSSVISQQQPMTTVDRRPKTFLCFRVLLLLCACPVATLAHSAVASRSTGQRGEAMVPEFRAAPLSQDIQRDGKLDDAGWASAVPITCLLY